VEIGTAERLGIGEAAQAIKEIRPFYGGRDDLYREWILTKDKRTAKPCSIKMAAATSRVSLRCPREVQGGRPITVEVDHVGNRQITWHAYIIYPCPVDGYADEATNRSLVRPDSGRYELMTFAAGAKIRGAKKKTLYFSTYPADKGKYLGVRVENPKRSEDGHTFWVRIK
jgi:hypothetical protein